MGAAVVTPNILSSTIGTLYSAATGAADPFLIAEQNDENARAIVKASAGKVSYDQALSQVEQTSNEVADSQHVSWSDAAKTWVSGLTEDDGSGCSVISNPGGCIPPWLPYAAAGAGVLFLLWLLRPYV